MENNATPRAPATFNKQAGKATTSENSFSDQNWGSASQGLARVAECHSNTQLAYILQQAKLVAYELDPDANGENMEDSEDEYTRICE